MKRLLAAALLFISAAALAAGSTINPAIPATNAAMASAPVRNNFAAAYADINALIQQNASATAPASPLLGQLWLNTTATPYVLNEWDGANWVARGTLNATTHAWISVLANSALLPIQTITGASHTFVTADLYQKTRRSNSGTAMTDTLMASTGLLNGTQINIANVDATASDTVTAGAGTTIGGNATFVITAGRDMWWSYDLTNTQWRPIANTGIALLGPTVTHSQQEIDTSYTYSTPTTGNTITLASGTETAIINPSGTLAALTVTLPACTAAYDGSIARFSSSQIITTLTVSATSGSVADAPASLAVGGGAGYLCRGAGTTWYRLY